MTNKAYTKLDKRGRLVAQDDRDETQKQQTFATQEEDITLENCALECLTPEEEKKDVIDSLAEQHDQLADSTIDLAQESKQEEVIDQKRHVAKKRKQAKSNR